VRTQKGQTCAASDICMYVSMHACMYACMYVHTYIRMHVCMYVCTYTHGGPDLGSFLISEGAAKSKGSEGLDNNVRIVDLERSRVDKKIKWQTRGVKPLFTPAGMQRDWGQGRWGVCTGFGGRRGGRGGGGGGGRGRRAGEAGGGGGRGGGGRGPDRGRE
jgi:uncharacterized membrane protein YgcG